MITYLLDTDISIAALRNHPKVVDRLSGLSPQSCAISSITAYELLCGVRKARNPEQERRKVELFTQTISQLAFDLAAADAAAAIRSNLERRGMIIGPYDLLIAGHAIVLNLTLVSANVAEFSRVHQLRLESWL